MNAIRNIGIFAHVDAGKTTLSEQLLAHAGAIRTRGSVDSGTAHTDRLPVERRRGISVKAACVTLSHRDTLVNLIDTPGHVDFSAEVERSLWALDAAVIVVCAVEGVQPQTELLFRAMEGQHIPVVFFVNKIDRDGGDHQFHTHPLDFIVAAPMAIQDGLRQGGSVLLEPILEAKFYLPTDCVGRVMSDIITMRGQVLDNAPDGGRVILTALLPVQTSLDYAITLAAATGGRGAMSVRLHGYEECPPNQGTTAPRRGVDPLDTSKYILAARSALEGGIFDY